jgi:hypothetical protein
MAVVPNNFQQPHFEFRNRVLTWAAHGANTPLPPPLPKRFYLNSMDIVLPDLPPALRNNSAMSVF